MDLTANQEIILKADGHLLVIGGPGSGKTTIAILKAARLVTQLQYTSQRVLFLSFARATVSRVIEAIEHEQNIPDKVQDQIEVDTYHSFFWRLLKSHGYLIGLPRRLEVLTTGAEAIALAELRSQFPGASKLTAQQKVEKKEREEAELMRLAFEEGRVCFDLFAPLVSRIVDGSDRIRRIIATRYPIIMLDEFQDTNAGQWGIIRTLGQRITLLALADPEQRIYDWIGADPRRLDHFKQAFQHTFVDLSTDNHRSKGTDIAAFGNDLLAGVWTRADYSGITIDRYVANSLPQALSALVVQTYASRKRIANEVVNGWSLAILVPTRKMTRLVSDAFRSPPASMPPIGHTASIELEAAILGAELISFLLQPGSDAAHLPKFIELLCNFFQGKGGDKPTKKDLKEAAGLRSAYKDALKRAAEKKKIKGNSILLNVLDTYKVARSIQLTGEPDKDWRSVRKSLEDGACERLRMVAEEARNVRVLERGGQLRNELSQNWRDKGSYADALEIVQQSFIQQHFAVAGKVETGVLVMNMHKAKGKQFDEVIIFEGTPAVAGRKIVANPNRIVRENLIENANDQARQNLRVSITRGKRRTTIMTPHSDPCILLP